MRLLWGYKPNNPSSPNRLIQILNEVTDGIIPETHPQKKNCVEFKGFLLKCVFNSNIITVLPTHFLSCNIFYLILYLNISWFMFGEFSVLIQQWSSAHLLCHCFLFCLPLSLLLTHYLYYQKETFCHWKYLWETERQACTCKTSCVWAKLWKGEDTETELMTLWKWIWLKRIKRRRTFPHSDLTWTLPQGRRPRWRSQKKQRMEPQWGTAKKAVWSQVWVIFLMLLDFLQ